MTRTEKDVGCCFSVAQTHVARDESSAERKECVTPRVCETTVGAGDNGEVVVTPVFCYNVPLLYPSAGTSPDDGSSPGSTSEAGKSVRGIAG